MHVVLCVDSVQPMLAGIGRNCVELARRIPLDRRIDGIRYLNNRHWVSGVDELLLPTRPHSKSGWLGQKISDVTGGRFLKRAVIHSPNYFLPAHVSGGIVTIHDLSVFRYPETHPVERIADFEKRFEASIARAEHIIVDTNEIRRELLDFTGIPSNKVSTVYLGVSEQYHPRPAIDCGDVLDRYGLTYGRYSLCVSSLEPRKRIDRLISAYRLLDRRLRDRFPLVLSGGSGWLNEGLMSQIDEARREGWLRLLGYTPEADLPTIYSAAAVFAYPSIYEGFGLPPIEAMASGVPVVASNRSCLPEVTDGAAMLVDPDNTEGLSEALRLALEDEAWREGAVQRGSRVASRYGWSQSVTETIDVYERVLTERF